MFKRVIIGDETCVYGYTKLFVRDSLAKSYTKMMLQLPYSLDLVPCGFSVFLKLKTLMRRQRLATTEETALTKELKFKPKSTYQTASTFEKTVGKSVLFLR